MPSKTTPTPRQPNRNAPVAPKARFNSSTKQTVLFELFQNADDAAVELGRCEALGAKSKFQSPRVASDKTSGLHVRAFIGGRLINYRGPSSLPDRWSGFGDDLRRC